MNNIERLFNFLVSFGLFFLYTFSILLMSPDVEDAVDVIVTPDVDLNMKASMELYNSFFSFKDLFVSIRSFSLSFCLE